jgi:hypothetical protein
MEVYVGALELRLGPVIDDEADRYLYQLLCSYKYHQDHLKEYIEAMDEDYERRCAYYYLREHVLTHSPRADACVQRGGLNPSHTQRVRLLKLAVTGSINS